MDPVRYTLTLDGFAEGLLRGTAADRRQTRLRYGAYALVFAGLWVLSDRLAGPGFNPTGALWLACAVGFGLFAVLRPWLVRRQLHRVLEQRADLERRVEIRLLGADLVIEVEGIRTTRHALAALKDVEAFDDGVLLELLAQEYLWVPASAFADADAQSRFVRAIREAAPLPDPAL